MRHWLQARRAAGHEQFAQGDVLLPDRTRPGPERVRHFAKTARDNIAGALKAKMNAGIGPTIEGLGGVLDSRADADRVLRVLAGGPTGEVAHIDDVRSRAVLLSIRDLAARHPELRAGKLERLVALDGADGTYVETLRAYLDAFGDVSAAAARLNVHTNTFRYRLRRLAELAAIDLLDPAERLVMHLQLTFLDGDATLTS